MVLAAILKLGKREDLKSYTETIFNCIISSKCLDDFYRLSRKYAIKIIQRIGKFILHYFCLCDKLKT